MIADPLTLQHNHGDASFDTVFTQGSKTIRRLRLKPTGTTDCTLTVSHDENPKTKRKRSVVRLDSVAQDPSGVKADESHALYVVFDTPKGSYTNAEGTYSNRLFETLLSFFTNDPGASTTGTITYATLPSLVEEFLRGES